MNCKFCGKEVPIDSTFCPNCGKKLKEESMSLGKELGIYVFDVFLAPFGLVWFFKYFRSLDSAKKRVAYMSLLITIVTVVLTVYITVGYIKSVTSLIYSPQYNSLRELGL